MQYLHRERGFERSLASTRSVETARWGWTSVVAAVLVAISFAALLALLRDRNEVALAPYVVSGDPPAVINRPPLEVSSAVGTIVGPSDAKPTPTGAAQGGSGESAATRPPSPIVIDAKEEPREGPSTFNVTTGSRRIASASHGSLTEAPAPDDAGKPEGPPAGPPSVQLNPHPVLRTPAHPYDTTRLPGAVLRRSRGVSSSPDTPYVSPSKSSDDAMQRQWSLLRPASGMMEPPRGGLGPGANSRSAPRKDATTPAPAEYPRRDSATAGVDDALPAPARQPPRNSSVASPSVDSPQETSSDVSEKSDEALKGREQWLRDQLQIR